MKNKILPLFLTTIIISTLSSFVKPINISQALVLIFLILFSAFVIYIDKLEILKKKEQEKKVETSEDEDELAAIEKQLRIEQTKANLEDIKHYRVAQQVKRDTENARENNPKKFTF